MTRNRRHRGTAGGWIILLVILLAGSALVAWKMFDERSNNRDQAGPTTQHE